MGKDDSKKQNKKTMKKPIRIIKNIISVLTILAMGFLIYSIYLISGIETEIRYLAMIAILLVNILFIILLRKMMKKDGLVKFIIFLILSSVLIFGQGILGYYVFKTYSSLNSINKNEITYETAIVVKKDSKILDISALNNKKIGIVVDEASIDGYVIGLDIIKENKLDSKDTIVEYDSASQMMADLYSNKVDAIIISSNYPSMFRSITGYEDVDKDTKIIYKKAKKFTKDEIAKTTGDEVVNFNTSDSITKPFTVLVMGIDSETETLDKNATGNGDALMLVTFNPKTLNATIFSIPRDTYVPIACFAGQKENKITHAAWNGESCMIKTIQNFTGINIDYYVKINFKGVVKLVDAMGGIEVDVPDVLDGVCEQNSNRSFASNDIICFKKGKQTLNGEQALAMARHRKTLTTGDFQRGVHQQIIVQAMLNKLKSVRSANQALSILDAVSNSMDTNFTTKQLLSFYDIAKNIIMTSNSDSLINLQQLYLTGSGQMIYDEGIGLVLYDFIYNQSSLDQIVKAMKDNLSENHVNKNKTMDFNIEDNYEMEVIGKNPTSGTKLYTLLPSFVGQSKSYAMSWLNAHNIKVTIEEKEVTSGYSDGQIISQSLPESKRIDLIGSDGIKLVVAKLKEEIIDNTPTDPKDDDKDDNTNPTEPTDPTDPVTPVDPDPTKEED